jgi:hypothetical protein
MSELGKCDKLPLTNLTFGLLHESALFGGEYVVGINHAPGLDKHPILCSRECHEIPLLDVEGLEHVPRNSHLATLTDPANPLLGCG